MEASRRLQLFNRDMLKVIAAAAMLLDHIGWRFLVFSSPLAQLFHTVGRITLPIMCFFIAEGYGYTHSKKKYGLRLLLFALLSQVPYAMFRGNPWYTPDLNVIFTLLFCFLAILFYDKIQNGTLRWIAVLSCTAATWCCDWPVTAVLFALTFWIFREDEKKRAAAFSAVAIFYFCFTLSQKLEAGCGLISGLLSSLFTLGVFLALVLLLLYNHQKGRFSEGKWGKWFFYLFYPAQLLLLALL